MPSADGPELLFYDGTCGLCHRTVKFVLARDRGRALFQFAPLQGETADRVLRGAGAPELPDSIVLRQADGAILFRSDAILHILQRLGGIWSVIATVGRIIPRAVRDAVYNFIARIRTRIFEAPQGYCPMLPDELQSRFLP